MSEDFTERSKEGRQTPRDIFHETIKETSRLDQEASRLRDEGLDKKSAEQYRKLLRERAQLVVNLPEKIEESTGKGDSFPKQELYVLKGISFLGSNALENDTITCYMLSSFLTPLTSNKGAEIGDPNLLEEVYQRVYGTEPEKA